MFQPFPISSTQISSLPKICRSQKFAAPQNLSLSKIGCTSKFGAPQNSSLPKIYRSQKFIALGCSLLSLNPNPLLCICLFFIKTLSAIDAIPRRVICILCVVLSCFLADILWKALNVLFENPRMWMYMRMYVRRNQTMFGVRFVRFLPKYIYISRQERSLTDIKGHFVKPRATWGVNTMSNKCCKSLLPYFGTTQYTYVCGL